MDDAMKVMPVCQMVMLVKEGTTPVGIEVVWENGVRERADACTVLNLLRHGMADAMWITRQVGRVDREDGEATVQ
jgi:hypothetical protein